MKRTWLLATLRADKKNGAEGKAMTKERSGHCNQKFTRRTEGIDALESFFFLAPLADFAALLHPKT